MSVKSPIPTERYRPNVAALILDKNDNLLICERIETKGAWQFPQGGVDPGEDFITALHREVWEEIGLNPEDYDMIDQRGIYRYKYPAGVREKKKKKYNCVGQEQTYFLCKLKVPRSKVDVHQTPPEFQDLDWIDPKDFKLKWLPKFKQEVYKSVFKDFFNCSL